MGHQIVKQPDGRLAVFSTTADGFLFFDATEEEVVEYYAEEAAERARESTRRTIEMVKTGKPRAPYAQFTLSWKEAMAMHVENGFDEEP